MKKWFLLFLWISYSTCLWSQTTGQVNINVDLPSVSLLDVEPSGGISLSLQAPTEAGMPVSITSNNSKWLNFTSAVGAGSTRSIWARVSSGAIPSGLGLRMYVSGYSGWGGGNLGNSIYSILLGGSNQQIVSGIGGSYTGSGSGTGYSLTYALEIQNYSQLKHDNFSSITVTFTFMDN